MLGPLEIVVMETLWRCGESTVRDVVDRIERPLAYTTVMTTLDRLFKKGLLNRRKEQRAFFYAPRFARTEWEQKRAGDLVAGFLSSSEPARELLISSLVEAVGQHDEALLDELERKIRLRRKELSREEMIVSYGLRLVCLSLAVFLLIHTLLGLFVAGIAASVVRTAQRIRPRTAARLLLALRLAPSAVAIFVVAAFCIPSYLWLEPEAEAEEVGWLCLAAAMAAAVLWCVALANTVLAWFRSSRYARQCERMDAPVLMLVGVFRPRLVVPRAIVDVLAPDQLNAAIRHEEAHQRARDNFKRLLMAATPGFGFRLLERAWSQMSEWAADDESVAGDSLRSLSLAGALVAVARLGAARRATLAVSFCGDTDDLSRRVDRLLHPQAFAPMRPGLLVAAGVPLAASLVAILLQHQTLQSAHRLLEYLVH